MPYYKFEKDDLYYNRIKTYPKYDFFIYDKQVYFNNRAAISGAFATEDDHAELSPDDTTGHIKTGFISLYELNVDRPSDAMIHPFVTKDGSLTSISTVTANFDSSFNYGDKISGTYPLSASISRNLYLENAKRTRITALKNSLEHYTKYSPRYAYSSSLAGDKSTETLNLISIPSIFYGSSIKRGSVNLKYYMTGTLISQAQDVNRNGELIQTGPPGGKGSGSVAGVVLYDEGFIVLTGSWDLCQGGTKFAGPHGGNWEQDHENEDVDFSSPQWVYFGTGMGQEDEIVYSTDGSSRRVETTWDLSASSYNMTFEGVNYIPNLTMLAHAPRTFANFSPNPSYGEYESYITASVTTGSGGFQESPFIPIKNTISSSYCQHSASFSKQTYISHIGVYDEYKNLIGVAKVANPVRKRENDNFTFKIKVDF